MVPGCVYEEGASSFHAPNPLPDLRHWLACLLAQDAMVTFGREEGEINRRTSSADLGSDGVRGVVVGMAETTVPGLESGNARCDESRFDGGGNTRERVKTLADTGTMEKSGTAAVAESDTRRVEADKIAMRAVAESANGDKAHGGGGDVQRMIEDEVLAAAERQTNLPDASGEDDASIDAADTARGDGSQLEEVGAHGTDVRRSARVKQEGFNSGRASSVGRGPVGRGDEGISGGQVALILRVAVSIQIGQPF